MDKNISLPVYLKISQIILGLIGFFFVLYVGQTIILPLIFSLLIAILLNPLVNFLHGIGCNRIIAILISILLGFFLITGICYFLISQATSFTDSFPQIQIKFNHLIDDIIKWISQTFNVSIKKVNDWLAKQRNDGLDSTTSVIRQTLTTISGMFVTVFLVPVYVFMFLFYKTLLLQFISMLFPRGKQHDVGDVLTASKSLIQNYLVGLLAEAAIVAALNSAGLLILGIDYAILLGIIGAILNVIPYIGGIIAIALPMLIALATKTPASALWVFVAYMIVQFIDNHYIVPYIVASRVKINALVSIVVVLIGGTLWGIPGMFLSIPLTAIIKVILDRIEPLKPFGFLLGDTMPPIGKNIFNFKMKKSAKGK